MKARAIFNILMLICFLSSVSSIVSAQDKQSNGLFGPVDLNRHIGVGDINQVHYNNNNGPGYTDNGLKQQDITRTHIGVGGVNGDADIKPEETKSEEIKIEDTGRTKTTRAKTTRARRVSLPRK